MDWFKKSCFDPSASEGHIPQQVRDIVLQLVKNIDFNPLVVG